MIDQDMTTRQAAPQADSVEPNASQAEISQDMRIVNKKGLHARATAKFVQCVENYACEVTVSRCGETVGGASIMGILTLGAGIGSTITVRASGPQAAEAIHAIDALVANRFGEEE